MSAINHFCTDEPVCPYCGNKDRVGDTLGPDPTEEQCEACGETYRVTPEYSVSYTTEKLAKAEGGDQ